MTLYDELRAVAAELLDEFGGAATLERRTKTYDKTTRATTETVSNISVKAVLLPPAGSITMAERRGETVRRERYAVVASAQEPKVGDTLLMAGIRYPVSGVTAVSPDGAAIVYRMALGEA